MRLYTVVMPCRWGWFTGLAADPFQTASVYHYGEFARAEFNLMRQFVKPKACVLDVGANVGNISMGLAHAVGDGGLVIAFEPQRFCYGCLWANVANNGLMHIVHPHMLAVGDKCGSIGVPPYPIDSKVCNSGGVSLLEKHQITEQVQIVTIDSINLERCDFIKVDVEGMEPHVLRGARETITRFRPTIMCEQLDHMQGTREALVEIFKAHAYKAWKVWTPLHDPDNIKLNREPVFKINHDQNIIAVPNEAPDPILPEVNERLA
jgi:FkbM family methyltransferase